MAPFGALKSLMLDHFGFKALYGGICWLKLSHVDSSWVDLGLSWSALGLTWGRLGGSLCQHGGFGSFKLRRF